MAGPADHSHLQHHHAGAPRAVCPPRHQVSAPGALLVQLAGLALQKPPPACVRPAPICQRGSCLPWVCGPSTVFCWLISGICYARQPHNVGLSSGVCCASQHISEPGCNWAAHRACCRYGIPFPVLARASFGIRGANLPALMRCAAHIRIDRIGALSGSQALLPPKMCIMLAWRRCGTKFDAA